MKNRYFQSFHKNSSYLSEVISAFILIAVIASFGIALLNKSNAAIKPLTPGTSWQWQLTGTVDTTVLDNVSNSKKMYDIDLFDNSAATISSLKAKGITVVCYFSAGTSENWRPDFGSFPASVQGSGNGWPGEKWLDVRQWGILGPLMSARMDLAVSKGCDGIEPDNVDGYSNSTGFPITAADQITFNKNIAAAAHARGLNVALKNDVDQISQLVSSFDWALNEECYHYNECDGYSAFTAQNKLVAGVEYTGQTSSFCPKANAANYDWLKKDLDLTATRTSCREGNGSVTPPPTPPPPPPTVPAPPPPPPPDATPPTVSLSAPANGAAVSGSSVTVSANASDNVAVVGVRFKLDGNNLGAEDITPAYSITWNTTTASNGSHTLTAVARDAAGNTTTSVARTVTVSNAVSPPPVTPPTPPPPTCKTGDINCDGITNILDLSILLSHYGQGHSASDINNDNVVNIFDLSTLLSNYGK
jgi:hypothetical protein